MRRTLLLVLFAMGVCIVPSARAQDVEPFNLALWSPVQIYDPSKHIHGVRLSLYGLNEGVQGVDIGVINATEQEGFKGFQYGIIGLNDGDMVGWQNNHVFNQSAGEARGLQTGLVNRAGKMVGAQLGFINATDSAHGFQLAVVNYTQNLKGLQIGLVCIANEVPGHPILPIVNFSF